MATAWMHSDAAVDEESLSRVPGLSIRKQNQSGNCAVAQCLASRALDSGQTIDKYLFSYPVFAESFSQIGLPSRATDTHGITCHLCSVTWQQAGLHIPRVLTGGRGQEARGCQAHPSSPSTPPPSSQVSRGHLWLDQNHPLDLGKVRGLLIGSSQEIFGRSNRILPFLWVPVFHYSLTQKGSEDKQSCGLRAAVVVIYLSDLELNLGRTTRNKRVVCGFGWWWWINKIGN